MIEWIKSLFTPRTVASITAALTKMVTNLESHQEQMQKERDGYTKQVDALAVKRDSAQAEMNQAHQVAKNLYTLLG